MGQGTQTGIAMMVAEELDISMSTIAIHEAPPNEKLYKDPLLGFQGTGGSTATRSSWEPLRIAGATARALLVIAAAQQWNTTTDQCTTKEGAVFGPAGKKINYGKLVDLASQLPSPKQVTLKNPKEFKLIGRPAQRLDTPNKTNGKALYTIDLNKPDMLIASTITSPVYGGKLIHVDSSQAKTINGVRDIIQLDNAVAVTGETTWACFKALKALKLQWDLGENQTINSNMLTNALHKAHNKPGVLAKKFTNIGSHPNKKYKSISFVYDQPMLSHSPLEPMTCVAHVQEDKCELWVGTQVPTFAQKAAAEITQLPIEKVFVYNQLIGGAFGRRLEFDYVIQAVHIAKQVSYPIKLVWSREEDMTHDFYRPPYSDKITAILDKNNYPISWEHSIAGASIIARYAGSLPPNGVDNDVVEVAIDPVYQLKDLQVRYIREEPKVVPISWWRGVGALRSTFVIESFIDELAHNAHIDSITYRTNLVKTHPRLLNVLKLIKTKSNWGTELPEDCGRGVSAGYIFGSYIATVVELQVNATTKAVNIRKITCVIDCGIITNPTSVKTQIEGGTLFGLSAAFFNEIIIDKGQIQQTNFNEYRQIRMSDAPSVDVHLVKNLEQPGGTGETGTAMIAPALTNALFAASGHRARSLPLTRFGFYTA
ncbi:UNVERIFIED_CONTAM: hypothetical protein GTU68_052085 [Idotea baltica]|nr:hypothetical protein [Idotea baltica]